MKCSNCGFEFQDDFKYCTSCGAEAKASVASRVLAAIGDKLFLGICILLTASCAFSIIAGGLPLINILITIFLWLTYSQGCKGIADQNHLRCISGSVYASYVVTNVAAGIIAVCGVVIALLLGLLANSYEIIAALESELGAVYPDFAGLPQAVLGVLGWIFGLIFVVAGVIVLVINILGMKKIHNFAKSVYQGLSLPSSELANPREAKNWLIFFGVCSAVSALSALTASFISAAASGCSAAAIIIAAVLINKYFLTAEDK